DRPGGVLPSEARHPRVGSRGTADARSAGACAVRRGVPPSPSCAGRAARPRSAHQRRCVRRHGAVGLRSMGRRGTHSGGGEGLVGAGGGSVPVNESDCAVLAVKRSISGSVPILATKNAAFHGTLKGAVAHARRSFAAVSATLRALMAG